MAFTRSQLASLEKAIALGVRSMEHNGKRTEFQSPAQMIALRDRMINEIRAAEGAPGALPACMSRPTFYTRG